jgi:hypothetical protein
VVDGSGAAKEEEMGKWRGGTAGARGGSSRRRGDGRRLLHIPPPRSGWRFSLPRSLVVF